MVKYTAALRLLNIVFRYKVGQVDVWELCVCQLALVFRACVVAYGHVVQRFELRTCFHGGALVVGGSAWVVIGGLHDSGF